MLKSRKFNASVVLAFLECSCCVQNWVIQQKEPVSQICIVSSHFLTLAIELHLARFRLGASFAFELHCSLLGQPKVNKVKIFLPS